MMNRFTDGDIQAIDLEPVGRLGKPEEIADAVLWMSADRRSPIPRKWPPTLASLFESTDLYDGAPSWTKMGTQIAGQFGCRDGNHLRLGGFKGANDPRIAIQIALRDYRKRTLIHVGVTRPLSHQSKLVACSACITQLPPFTASPSGLRN